MFGLFKNRHAEKDREIMEAVLHMGFEAVKHGGGGYRSILEEVANKSSAERSQYFKDNESSISHYLMTTLMDVVLQLQMNPNLKSQTGFSRDEISGWFERYHKTNRLSGEIERLSHLVIGFEINELLAFNMSVREVMIIAEAFKKQDMEVLKAYGLVRDADPIDDALMQFGQSYLDFCKTHKLDPKTSIDHYFIFKEKNPDRLYQLIQKLLTEGHIKEDDISRVLGNYIVENATNESI